MLFNETIAVSGVRTTGQFKGSVVSRIVDNGIADAFDAGSSTTRIRDIMAFVRIIDWSAISNTLPQVGDIITLENRERFAVRSVNEIGAGIFTIGASQC